jgi:hypothetical protein
MLAIRGVTVAVGSLLCTRRLLLYLKKLRFKNVHGVCYGRCVCVDKALQ